MLPKHNEHKAIGGPQLNFRSLRPWPRQRDYEPDQVNSIQKPLMTQLYLAAYTPQEIVGGIQDDEILISEILKEGLRLNFLFSKCRCLVERSEEIQLE